MTKKIHPNQKETERTDGDLDVELFVEINRELEAKLLEFGKDVTILTPRLLRDHIRMILQQALAKYD